MPIIGNERYRLERAQQEAYEDHNRLCALIAELELENEKLRELAYIFCYCMHEGADCDGCKINGAEGEVTHDPLLACDGLYELLRELGVEVDE